LLPASAIFKIKNHEKENLYPNSRRGYHIQNKGLRRMKYLLTFFILIGTFTTSISQEINKDLKNKLAQIQKKDQGYRELSKGGISEINKTALLKELNLTEKEFQEKERELFERNDSLNLIEVEQIIAEHGYPGKSLVGEPENEAAWFVIQHSNKIEKYYPLIEKAGKKGELDITKVAMMKDRLLMDQGKVQIYGTQGKTIFLTENPKSQDDLKVIIWPIKNPKSVNKLRQKTGFKTSIEEYANKLNIDYKIYTLEEVNKMQKITSQ